MSIPQLEELRARLGGQAHVLSAWDKLGDVERAYLASYVAGTSVEHLERAFRDSLEQSKSLPRPDEIQQIDAERYLVNKALSAEELSGFRGAGTRLNFAQKC